MVLLFFCDCGDLWWLSIMFVCVSFVAVIYQLVGVTLPMMLPQRLLLLVMAGLVRAGGLIRQITVISISWLSTLLLLLLPMVRLLLSIMVLLMVRLKSQRVLHL